MRRETPGRDVVSEPNSTDLACRRQIYIEASRVVDRSEAG